jgi:hypothetical protein
MIFSKDSVGNNLLEREGPSKETWRLSNAALDTYDFPSPSTSCLSPDLDYQIK